MASQSVAIRRPARLFGGRLRRLGDRRGISFCYSVIVLTSMLVLGLVFMQVGLNSAKWAYGDYRGQQALFLAEAAVDRAVWMMQESSAGEDGINTVLEIADEEAAGGGTRTYQSATWPLGTGVYQFTAIAPHLAIPGTIELRATGIAHGGEREDVLVVLRPDSLPAGDPDDVEPAACFKYAMFSDHNLVINGSPQILGHMEDGGAGLYANGNIHFNGAASEVHGPIAAKGFIFGSTTQVPSNAGWSEGLQGPPMPEINMADFQTEAHEMYSGSWVRFENGDDAPLGTLEDPKIIFVNGKVKLAGQFTGVGVMVSTGGFRITGNVTYGSPDSSWAFLTTGTFTIAGTAQIHGLVYCHNAAGEAEFIGHGTPNIFGGVVADVITLTGDYTTEWDGEPAKIHKLPGAMMSNGPPVIETVAWERI